MISIETKSIGEAWEETTAVIRKTGTPMKDEDQDLIELCHVCIHVVHPEVEDPLLKKMDPVMGQWMQDNFTQIKKVTELKNSWSYGWRLHKYQNAIDQVAWVIETLQKKPESKSATISMLQGAGVEAYIPCVSLLDFKIRNGALWLTASCRSLDFGKKAYFNMINLAAIAKEVATKLFLNKFELFLNITSAHIYKKDLEGMK